MSDNNVIGVNNKLPWHLPDDLLFFKKKTLGKSIIMGRHTFESIPKKLKKRKVILLTRSPFYEHAGCTVANSLESALGLASGEDEVIIAGGGNIYAQFIDIVDKMYITRVHTHLSGDVYFPDFYEKNWRKVSSKYHPQDEKHSYSFAFMEYVRNK